MNLNKLKSWKETYNRGKGVDLIDISNLENKYGILFPLLYREFLKESGVYCAAIVQSHRFEFLDMKQQQAQHLLKDYNLEHLITKPFWVIATHEDAFWYFHLDEGDNPPIYRLDCGYYGDSPDEYTFGKVADSFQDWIEKAIAFYEEDPENH